VSCPNDSKAANPSVNWDDLLNKPCIVAPPRSPAVCEFDQDCCCGMCGYMIVCACEGGFWSCTHEDVCLDVSCSDGGAGAGGKGNVTSGGASAGGGAGGR
jgi:hypothetical protein